MSRMKIIIILGCLTVIVLSGIFAFTSYLDYFAPGDNIGIAISKSDQQGEHWQIVTIGKSTLWYQWQIWIYIGLFFLAVGLVGGILFTYIYGVILGHVEQKISGKKQKLDEKIADYKRSQAEFEKKKTQQIELGLAHKEHTLEIMIKDALDADEHARAALSKAERINKTTNHSHKAQNRENLSKLSQRDRLSEQKRVIAKFLQISGWKLPNGEPFTYNSLFKYSQKYDS